MAQPWACLGHMDDTQARTHELHDMCGVYPVTATIWGLVRPTFSPRWHKGAQAVCNKPTGKAMGTTPWFDGALDTQLTWAHEDYA